jgi:hypothetical protein
MVINRTRLQCSTGQNEELHCTSKFVLLNQDFQTRNQRATQNFMPKLRQIQGTNCCVNQDLQQYILLLKSALQKSPSLSSFRIQLCSQLKQKMRATYIKPGEAMAYIGQHSATLSRNPKILTLPSL